MRTFWQTYRWRANELYHRRENRTNLSATRRKRRAARPISASKVRAGYYPLRVWQQRWQERSIPGTRRQLMTCWNRGSTLPPPLWCLKQTGTFPTPRLSHTWNLFIVWYNNGSRIPENHKFISNWKQVIYYTIYTLFKTNCELYRNEIYSGHIHPDYLCYWAVWVPASERSGLVPAAMLRAVVYYSAVPEKQGEKRISFQAFTAGSRLPHGYGQLGRIYYRHLHKSTVPGAVFWMGDVTSCRQSFEHARFYQWIYPTWHSCWNTWGEDSLLSQEATTHMPEEGLAVAIDGYILFRCVLISITFSFYFSITETAPICAACHFKPFFWIQSRPGGVGGECPTALTFPTLSIFGGITPRPML